MGRCDKAKYDKPVLRELIAEVSKQIRLYRYRIEHSSEIKVVPRYQTSFGGRFFMEVWNVLKLEMPFVETKRLILRPVCLDDAEDMYAYCSDDEVLKYLWFEKHDSVEFTAYIIDKLFLNRRVVGMPDPYAIVLKENGHMIGTIDVNQVYFNEVGVIGYVIHRDHWGKGLVLEALETLIPILFHHCGFYRLEINHCADNVGSARVIEKAGFILEGRFRKRKKERDGHRADYLYYGLCKDDELALERYGKEKYEETTRDKV